MKRSVRTFSFSLFAVIFGILVSVGFTSFLGESPKQVLSILFSSVFGSRYDFGMTLFFMVPLILTGLAVAIPYRAGLFNIGAEGQLTVGAMAASMMGTWFPETQSWWKALLQGLLVSGLAGGFYGAIAGYLKARRGVHEVISTILLNFISFALISYFILYVNKDPESAQAETPLLPEVFHIPTFSFFEGVNLGYFLFLGLILPVLLHFWFRGSVQGYELKVVGLNPVASEHQGISKERVWIQSMIWAGVLAGFVGAFELLQNAHRLRLGFSSDFGFIGIAIALVARGNLLAIIPSAFLFAALQKGAGSLDIETDRLTRDLVYILQGVVILFVSIQTFFRRAK